MRFMARLIIVLFIINYSSGVSYNQPKLSICASWNLSAITFANESVVGKKPVGIFINTQNTIHIGDRENGRVLIWHKGSSTPTRILSGKLTYPQSLFVTNNSNVYATNSYFNNRIDKWTLNSTTNEFVINVNGTCTGLFVVNNTIYCSLTDHHRVVKIELDNKLMMSIVIGGTGCPGPVSNMLDHPHGIFVDHDFNLYVADSGNNRIQYFSRGQLNGITMAGFPLTKDFILRRPTGTVLDADGDLFIVDSDNHRIIRSILATMNKSR